MDVATNLLVGAGVESVLINAAGDLVSCGGQPSEDGEVKPWNIGVPSPDDVSQIVKTFDVVDGSVATSGDYEKGAHIVYPHTGLIAIGARSASVVGPEGRSVMRWRQLYWSMGGMHSGGWGGQSWLNTVSGSSIEMMRLRGPMGLIRGIEYGKIGAWRRQVDSAALI